MFHACSLHVCSCWSSSCACLCVLIILLGWGVCLSWCEGLLYLGTMYIVHMSFGIPAFLVRSHQSMLKVEGLRRSVQLEHKWVCCLMVQTVDLAFPFPHLHVQRCRCSVGG